jgi:hypothetical protein
MANHTPGPVEDQIQAVLDFAHEGIDERRYLMNDCPYESQQYTDEDRDNFLQREADYNAGVQAITQQLEKLEDVKTWTVILLYPDYATDGNVETYTSFITCTNPRDAARSAQLEAHAECEYIEADEFHPLAVLEGRNMTHLGPEDFE